MLIKEIGIQRFRSLYDCDLSLKPLTLIIGPNGSGKSNLLKALRFLHIAVAGDAKEWQSYESLIDDLLWYGSSPKQRPQDLQFRVIGSPDSRISVEYVASFLAAKLLQVAEESLLLDDHGKNQKNAYFERHHDSIRIDRTDLKARAPQTLTLREWGPDFSQSPFTQFYRHVAGWKFFEVDPRSARAGRFIPPDPEDVPSLEADASNLSAFLYALHRLREDDFEAVIEALRHSIELPERIVVEHDHGRGGSQARYLFKEAPFGNRLIPAESMSDGTIRLLSYMALLLADRSVSMACIEEPDSGLHPKLMLHLADALRQATQTEAAGGLRRQVLVTTHSPELMDCFDLAEEADYLQVYVVSRNEAGQTQFTPVTADEFAPWLEKYRLGEAVRRRFV